jgi:hypothetical protein
MDVISIPIAARKTETDSEPTTIVKLSTQGVRSLPWALTPAGVEKRVEEPEGRIAPRGCKRLILLFLLLG